MIREIFDRFQIRLLLICVVVPFIAGAIVWKLFSGPAPSADGLDSFSPRVATLTIPAAMVSISPDGKITYEEGYTPDAAAKAFWDAIGLERAARNCK